MYKYAFPAGATDRPLFDSYTDDLGTSTTGWTATYEAKRPSALAGTALLTAVGTITRVAYADLDAEVAAKFTDAPSFVWHAQFIVVHSDTVDLGGSVLRFGVELASATQNVPLVTQGSVTFEQDVVQ